MNEDDDSLIVFLKKELEAERFKRYTITHEMFRHSLNLHTQ